MLAGGRFPVLEASYLQDLDAECLQPGEEPVQGGLIPKGAVQDGFYRLYRGGEPVEIEQSFRREDSSYPDLIVRRWHRGPPVDRKSGVANFQDPAFLRAAPHSRRMNSSPW
jgi:hypothetical protein